MTSWRKVLVLCLTAASVPFAALTGFLAFVTATGCLFDCTDADPVQGALLAVLALALLVVGPVAARLMQTPAAGPVGAGLVLGAAGTWVVLVGV